MSNYPLGAENDPRAPYNQYDPKPIKVKVTISQSLSRSTTLDIPDYTSEEWEDRETDEDGNLTRSGGVEYNFSNVDFVGEYELQDYTIQELLAKLKYYLIRDIKTCPEGDVKNRLGKMLRECDQWTIDETEVVPDK